MPSKKKPNPPVSRKMRYMAEAVLVYMLYGFFKIMPVDMASYIGGWMMRQIGSRMAARRKAERHIAFALPELSKEQQKAAVLDMWDNLGRVFAEYPHLKTLHSRMEFVGGEYLDQLRKENKPAIVVSGHFANWEACPIMAEQHGIPVHLVYRPPNNIYLDGLLTRARSKGGAIGHISKNVEGARQMLKVLKSGGRLGVLVDQKFNQGIAVPFFGADAMTTPTPTQLASRLDCPLYPARIERLHGAHFRVTVYPRIPVPDTGDKEQDSYIMLSQIHALFEDWIRERPGQWLWLHRRWPKEALDKKKQCAK
jgi:KDO2-lipid IV(A) lauroyltransferase